MYDEQPYDDDDDAAALQPGDPDYDLSEQHGYIWEPRHEGWPPKWLIATVSVIVVIALLLPALLLILRYA